MSFVDFFKKKFSKQPCTICGSECGMMHRTKIQGDEYVCNDCKRQLVEKDKGIA